MAIYANENSVMKELTNKTDYGDGFVINSIKYLGTLEHASTEVGIDIANYTGYKYIIGLPIQSDDTSQSMQVSCGMFILETPLTFQTSGGLKGATTRSVGWAYSGAAGRGGLIIKATLINSTGLNIQFHSNGANYYPKYLVFGLT